MRSSEYNWQYTGDVSPEEYGGKWFRRVGKRVYQVIELTNMDEACGPDNHGSDRYVVELSLVDLNTIPQKGQTSALRCCGQENEALSDSWLAVCCFEYGCQAPLESWSGNAFGKLLRQARASAHALKQDANTLADRLEQPVNKIGSTAREYMNGDINSAILRGLERGDRNAEILAKMGVLR
mgnify:CR=1 FL=1